MLLFSSQIAPASYLDILFGFFPLGWTAFGGPPAHIGLFEKVFVETRRWISLETFNEILSIAQCLPGPTTTQISFAIGAVKKGIPGGLASGFLFQFPGLLMMSLAGASAADVLANPAGWLRGLTAGLSAAGIGLVISASIGLAKGQCKDQTTSVLCLTSASIAYSYQSNWIFPLLIVIGGLATLFVNRSDDFSPPFEVNEKIDYTSSISRALGSAFLAAWISIWISATCLINTNDYEDFPELHWFEAFYRAGSIIFGGGQVVLPLLLTEVVQYEDTCVADDGSIIANNGNNTCMTIFRATKADSWITEEQFFAGLGIVQAMPGPIFNLSAYIGALAARRTGTNILTGIFAAWFGLSGPGIMVLFGVLPFWGEFRKFAMYRKALPGFNSSAVGLVVAAVIQMSFKVKDISPNKEASVVIAMLAFYATFFGVPLGTKETDIWNVPAPLVVIGGGGLGVVAWALDF